MYLAAQEDAEIVAVGSVHGNVAASLGALNALRVLELVGLNPPVTVGAARPLAQPLQTAEFVHGEDGLGGHAVPLPKANPEPGSAAEQIVRLARANPGELTLLALGPLTNVALAVLLEPDLPGLLRSVVIMGGAVTVPGNITPYADANFYHDPEAADLVLGAGFPELTLVALDATEQARFGVDWLGELSKVDNPRADFANKLLDHYGQFYSNMFGEQSCTLHDPLAAAIALDPKLASYRTMPLGVELTGTHTRGQVVSDLRSISSDAYISTATGAGRVPVKVAETVDVPTFRDLMLKSLKD
jgi:purine nucleosidase